MLSRNMSSRAFISWRILLGNCLFSTCELLNSYQPVQKSTLIIPHVKFIQLEWIFFFQSPCTITILLYFLMHPLHKTILMHSHNISKPTHWVMLYSTPPLILISILDLYIFFSVYSHISSHSWGWTCQDPPPSSSVHCWSAVHLSFNHTILSLSHMLFTIYLITKVFLVQLVWFIWYND